MTRNWLAQSEELSHNILRFTLEVDSHPATFADVFQSWREDALFRKLFNGILADSPFDAFRWETPSVTSATTSQPFEFVLLDTPGLLHPPDLEAFDEYFGAASKSGVVAFHNLGGDAILVVPSPIASHSAYGHIAAFVREAPESQRHALWQRVGVEMTRRVNKKPVWLSTAGAGVSWLHVRLDDRPKYYGFEPFK